MDCQMLVLDGYIVIWCWCEYEVGSYVVWLLIVVMIVNVMVGDCECCLQVGMDDYFFKFIQCELLQVCLLCWYVLCVLFGDVVVVIVLLVDVFQVWEDDVVLLLVIVVDLVEEFVVLFVFDVQVLDELLEVIGVGIVQIIGVFFDDMLLLICQLQEVLVVVDLFELCVFVYSFKLVSVNVGVLVLLVVVCWIEYDVCVGMLECLVVVVVLFIVEFVCVCIVLGGYLVCLYVFQGY